MTSPVTSQPSAVKSLAVASGRLMYPGVIDGVLTWSTPSLPSPPRSSIKRKPMVESGHPRESGGRGRPSRTEEHPSELQSLMRISYAVFTLTKQRNPLHLVHEKT